MEQELLFSGPPLPMCDGLASILRPMTGSADNSNHDDNSVFWKEELASVSYYLASSGSSLVFASEAKYFNSSRVSILIIVM